MQLICVLRRFVLKLQVERDLITLVNHVPMTFHHPADVKTQHALDRPEIFFGPIHERIRGLWFLWIGEKNDDVRKHEAQNLECHKPAVECKSRPQINRACR